jgi:hypothetical protein
MILSIFSTTVTPIKYATCSVTILAALIIYIV